VDLEAVLAKVLGPALRHVGSVAGDMQAELIKAMERVGGARLAMATFRWISDHFAPSDTVDVYNELILACRRNLEFEQAMEVRRTIAMRKRDRKTTRGRKRRSACRSTDTILSHDVARRGWKREVAAATVLIHQPR
jgi:hypothetical protein